MTFVCLALVAALAIVVIAGVQVLSWQQRSHARREDLLINQILHLSGRTWTPPPSDPDWVPARDGEPLVREWTTQPEQQPHG